MDALPIVPFGKHKGEPITTLINDTAYLEWCKQQEWFKKYPIIYNICVNQTITTNNKNSKTPEHNKLQNIFLEEKNVVKLLKKIFNKTSKNIEIGCGRVIFEGMFNWDLIIEGYNWWMCDCDWNEDDTKSCNCEAYKNYRKKYDIPTKCDDLSLGEVYCEIKPLLGDDYPCVLRKMKSQIELTNNYATKENDKNVKELNMGYFRSFAEASYERREIRIRPNFVLIIKEFESTTTTREQLITIFNQSRIKIIFTNKLFNDSPIQSKIEECHTIDTFKSDITQIQENNIEEIVSLKTQLLEAHKKIAQLEENHIEYDRWLKHRDEEIKRMLLSNKYTLRPQERNYNKDTMLDLKDVTYLEIPFQSKEEFKKYFGKWDRKNNLHYIYISDYTQEIKEFILTYIGYEVVWKLTPDTNFQTITNTNVDNKINHEEVNILLIPPPLETHQHNIQLEEDILITLKNKKQSKSIRDYFGK